MAPDGGGSAGDQTDQSVYQRVLGCDFDALTPVMRRYFGPIPVGHAGVGEGRYDLVGPRFPRISRLVLTWTARHDLLFPEAGTEVPFVVENRPCPDGGLTAARFFAFPGVVRVMRDVMHVDGDTIVERLGRGGTLEVVLRASVRGGGMRLESTRLALRIRGWRLPLPRVARVVVDERDDTDEPGCQRVDVRVAVALVGEVFRYTGGFGYRIVTDGATGPAVSEPLPTLSMWLTENSPT